MINDEIGTAPNLNDSKSKPLNIAKITSHLKLSCTSLFNQNT